MRPPEALARLLERWIPKGRDAADSAQEGQPLEPNALAQIRELADDDPSGVGKLVVTFLRDGQARIEAAAEAVERGDLAALSMIAHSLKGSSANLAASEVAKRCAELERACHDGDSDAARLSLARIETEFERASTALQAAFPLADFQGSRAERRS